MLIQTFLNRDELSKRLTTKSTKRVYDMCLCLSSLFDYGWKEEDDPFRRMQRYAYTLLCFWCTNEALFILLHNLCSFQFKLNGIVFFSHSFSCQICSSWLLLLSSVFVGWVLCVYVRLHDCSNSILFLVCNSNATKITFCSIFLAKKEENWKESHTKYNKLKQYCTNVSLKSDTHTKKHKKWSHCNCIHEAAKVAKIPSQ